MHSEAPTTGWLTALRRFVGLGGPSLAGLAVAAGVTAAAWGLPHPAAPWALTLADHNLGAGRPGAAVAAYEAVAAHNPSVEVRNEAHRRAALVYGSQLDRPAAARRHLQAVLAATGAPAARAELLEQLGELLLDEGQPVGAAARFEMAAEALPHHPRSGQLLLRAAQVLADHRRDRQAVLLYRRVQRDHPAFGGASMVGRAQVRLRKGQIERALTLFEQAVDHTYDPDLVEVARLGRTVCLERLGDLDSALAQLEEVDLLPDDIRAERVGKLRRRRPEPASLAGDGTTESPASSESLESKESPRTEAAAAPAPTLPEGIEVRVEPQPEAVELKTESGATIEIRVEDPAAR